VRANFLHALEQSHGLGVLHNDIKLSHVLLYDGISKFINIEESLVASDDEELRSKKYIQELLEILA
jgi:hypothetical protein